MAIIDTKGLEPFADLLKEIYGDLAKPGVAQVGVALATVIGLLNTCLSPIKFLNEKTELNRQNNLKQLAKRFSEIPPEKIVEAPPEIAVPIAEKLAYVSNEELRNLYIELLAKASTNDLNSTAHPSFINIVNNLSPDEAVLIKYLRKNNGIPFVNIELNKNDGKYGILLIDELVVIITELNLTFKTNLSAYISNLAGAGLVEIDGTHWYSDESKYEIYEIYLQKKQETYELQYKDVFEQFPKRKYQIKKGLIKTTKLGQMFFKAVLG
ncbi:DUF4393 domain-containing protein [Acinetobacter baumannii]|uniref:DUF4393 domain-containing protein n=1 Tax=Acinetobacter baumannii TaxID=470 RepID=UPI0038922829